MSWWSKLFSKEKAATSTPTYPDLIQQNLDLQEQLERERRVNASKRRQMASQMSDEQVLLRRYRAALEFYADAGNWRPKGLVKRVEANLDSGHKARAALGKN